MKFIRSEYYTNCVWCGRLYMDPQPPVRYDTLKRFDPKETTFTCNCGFHNVWVPVHKFVRIGKRIKIKIY